MGFSVAVRSLNVRVLARRAVALAVQGDRVVLVDVRCVLASAVRCIRRARIRPVDLADALASRRVLALVDRARVDRVACCRLRVRVEHRRRVSVRDSVLASAVADSSIRRPRKAR